MKGKRVFFVCLLHHVSPLTLSAELLANATVSSLTCCYVEHPRPPSIKEGIKIAAASRLEIGESELSEEDSSCATTVVSVTLVTMGSATEVFEDPAPRLGDIPKELFGSSFKPNRSEGSLHRAKELQVIVRLVCCLVFYWVVSFYYVQHLPARGQGCTVDGVQSTEHSLISNAGKSSPQYLLHLPFFTWSSAQRLRPF